MPPKISEYQQALYTTVTPVLGALIIVLNSFEIFCLYKFQKRKSNSFLYFLSLCASDVIAGVSMIVLKSMSPFMKTSLKDDKAAKEVYDVLKFGFIRFSLFLSVFNLSAMTLDRFFATVTPLRHLKYKQSFTRKVIVCVWFSSFICMIITYAATRFGTGNESNYDLLFPISSYPTTTIFIVCYPWIYKIIRHRRGKFQHSRRLHQQEVQFLKLALMTVFLFCICWLPMSTVTVLIAVDYIKKQPDISGTVFTLAFSNSFFNPIIYFLHVRKKILPLLSTRNTADSMTELRYNATLSTSTTNTLGYSSEVING